MSSLRFSRWAMASVLATAALWSCNNNNNGPDPEPTGSQPPQQTPPPMATGGGDMMQQLRAGCPMVVAGASADVTDTEQGVALTYTTEAGDVDDLRARVQHMAGMYGMHRGARGMMWHRMGRGRGGPGMGMGMGHMAGRGPMPAATATVTEVDNGARLELRPSDPSQLEALRAHVRQHQQRMESGECWMLQGAAKPEGAEEQAAP